MIIIYLYFEERGDSDVFIPIGGGIIERGGKFILRLKIDDYNGVLHEVEIERKAAQKLFLAYEEAPYDIAHRRLPESLFTKEEAEKIYRERHNPDIIPIGQILYDQ